MFKIDNQLNFIPQNYKDFLWEWHEAVILDEIINELDITEIIRSYSNFSRWTSAYHPRVFLKILFYGYMNQTFSSRKLSRKLKSDLAFMYLAWNNQPNFRTINKFRTDKWKMLEWIFFQIVSKAKTLWLISFWTMSLDGTKVYANASITKTQYIEWIDKRISQFFEEARKIDELEDTQYWDNEDNLPEELKTKEGRNKRRNEISEKKKKFEDEKEKIKKEIESKRQKWINQTNINSTDKDSRIMKMKNWWSWYNPQNITENQFIISSIVSSSPNDVNELIPTLEKVKKHYWVFPTKILADKWYASVRNYWFLEKNNIEWYIPHQKVQVNIDDYIYNKGGSCPVDRILIPLYCHYEKKKQVSKMSKTWQFKSGENYSLFFRRFTSFKNCKITMIKS